MVIISYVTRAMPFRSAVGGIPGVSDTGLAFMGFSKYFAAMVDVVVPQMIRFPCFEKNSDTIRLQSSRLAGRPSKNNFRGQSRENTSFYATA